MNPISNNFAKFVTYMTKNDAMAPIIGLEATVTGGRTIQAYKRGGEHEARERLIEESTGAIVWLWGVKFLNDYIGDPILKKIFGENFDVGTDKILRTPFENFMKEHPPKNLSKKAVAGIKATKVLASVLLADAFIGLVVPPLNQRLTRNLTKKENANKNIAPQDKLDLSLKENKKPTFKGSGFSAINAFTNAIEKTNTGKLLSTDAGLVSGRMYSARNGDERREIAIRDIGSIYFYMWAQNHVGNLLNFVETGRLTRLNPNSTNILDKYLTKFLESKGGELSVEEFKTLVLGKNAAEIKLPESLYQKFETAEQGFITKLLNRFKSKPTEPLQVALVKDIEGLFSESELTRIVEMSKLQPLRQGERVVTKQQIIDALNVAEINNPRLLNDLFCDFTGGHFDEKIGEYVGGASKDKFKYVSNDKLYSLKAQVEDYINDICKLAKDQKITLETLKKSKRGNLIFSGINFAIGFAVAAMFLSTYIPKFQYWVTKQKTGKDLFPGVYELEETSTTTIAK